MPPEEARTFPLNITSERKEKKYSELTVREKEKERKKKLKISSLIRLKSEINQQLSSSLREGHSTNPAP